MPGFGGNGAPFPVSTTVCAPTSFADYEALYNTWLGAELVQQQQWAQNYEDAAEQARLSAFQQAAQQIVIAGIQLLATKYIADKQYEIADRQMRIAEEEHERYKEHFWCVENLMADEACAEEMYVPTYDERKERTKSELCKQFDVMEKIRDRSRRRNCLPCAVEGDCDLEYLKSKSLADVVNKAYRYEETRRDFYDDRRFNRQLAVSGFGRNLQQGYVQLINEASQVALGALQTQQAGINNLLGTISGSLGGIIQSQFAPNTNFTTSSNQVIQGANALPANPHNPAGNFGGAYGGFGSGAGSGI